MNPTTAQVVCTVLIIVCGVLAWMAKDRLRIGEIHGGFEQAIKSGQTAHRELQETVAAFIQQTGEERLKQAHKEGLTEGIVRSNQERLSLIERDYVSKREHDGLMKLVTDGFERSERALQEVRAEISKMARIMARATGENGGT